MKAMIFHADRFGFAVESASERIGETAPEEVHGTCLDVGECLVALFHVEEADGPKQVNRLCKDVRRITEQVGAKRLVVAAFGHLSNSYATPSDALSISKQVVETCRDWSNGLPNMEFHTSPFGHNKTLVLHTKGHRDAIKHRSY